MKTTVTKTEFADMFFNMGRKENFSYDGLGALFDWLEEIEEDTGVEMEVDVIALCCEFSEYGDATECMEDHCKSVVDELGEDSGNDEATEWLNDRTMVIEFNGGIIIQQF